MDFTRKARFAADGGHTTTAPSSMTYSSVVSCDSIRLAFLIGALNDLDIMSCDLENAYLNALAEKRFGSKVRSKALRTMARYVLWFVHCTA
jgi:hypothetical protein